MFLGGLSNKMTSLLYCLIFHNLNPTDLYGSKSSKKDFFSWLKSKE
jgi:hypothetical protein